MEVYNNLNGFDLENENSPLSKNEFLNLSSQNYDKILEKYGVKTTYYQERLTW